MTPRNPADRARNEPDPKALAVVADHVTGGGLVVVPTDTVYGIGALAAHADAVARLLAAKGRGRQMPPPVLVAGPDQLEGIVTRPPAAARALMRAFWPGGLTLILDAAEDLEWDLGLTKGTVAVRMPDHHLTLRLLRLTGPMAVTSANRTGAPPATDADAARRAFPGRVSDAAFAPGRAGRSGRAADIVLVDGGPTPGAVPSTIVDLSGPCALAPVVVRDGVLTRDEIAAVLAPVVRAEGAGGEGPAVAEGSPGPGQRGRPA